MSESFDELKKMFSDAIIDQDVKDPLDSLTKEIIAVERKYLYGDEVKNNRLKYIRELLDNARKGDESC